MSAAFSARDPERIDALRRSLGRVAVWSFALQTHPAAEEQAALARYRALGYRTTWIPEGLASKEILSHAAILLAGASDMIVAAGIANIYARDPMAMANGARALAEAYPGRFVLGIGVSHAPSVAARGASYGPPIEVMRAYLDAMDGVPCAGPAPTSPVPLVLAALGPRMLELAAERTDGAHPYFVPVEHTAIARQHLGREPLLLVEQTAVLGSDASQARTVARAFAERYLALPNYARNLRRLGYDDDDITAGGSDRLIDAVIVQGDSATIAERVRQHLAAGADQVSVQLRSAHGTDLCIDDYGELAEQLADLMA